MNKENFKFVTIYGFEKTPVNGIRKTTVTKQLVKANTCRNYKGVSIFSFLDPKTNKWSITEELSGLSVSSKVIKDGETVYLHKTEEEAFSIALKNLDKAGNEVYSKMVKAIQESANKVTSRTRYVSLIKKNLV